METFDAIDESAVECWAGYCKFSDGRCETFDRRQAIRMFRAQQRAREGCLTGSLSFEPSASLLPMPQLLDSQQADILVTQCWLTYRLWELCMSHGLLLETPTTLNCDSSLHIILQVHGVGLIEKIYDITMSLVKAMGSSTAISLDSSFTRLDPLVDQSVALCLTARALLHKLQELIHKFRGGDHEYAPKTLVALSNIPEFDTST
jgi:hypothetical protein